MGKYVLVWDAVTVVATPTAQAVTIFCELDPSTLSNSGASSGIKITHVY